MGHLTTALRHRARALTAATMLATGLIAGVGTPTSAQPQSFTVVPLINSVAATPSADGTYPFNYQDQASLMVNLSVLQPITGSLILERYNGALCSRYSLVDSTTVPLSALTPRLPIAATSLSGGWSWRVRFVGSIRYAGRTSPWTAISNCVEFRSRPYPLSPAPNVTLRDTNGNIRATPATVGTIRRGEQIRPTVTYGAPAPGAPPLEGDIQGQVDRTCPDTALGAPVPLTFGFPPFSTANLALGRWYFIYNGLEHSWYSPVRVCVPFDVVP